VRKKSITNFQPFVKKNEKMPGPLGGWDFFLTHTVHCYLTFVISL